MAETSDELYSCLLKWLEGCLELGGTLIFEPTAVYDGNSLAECLLQLVPDFFTPSWRSRIMAETGGNWKLRWNNLKKIHRSIRDYYDSVLHVSLENFKMPDLALVAELGAKEDTARLIQLVLGIAIHCDQKDTYIQAIMGMQQDIQHVVMGAIQDLMSQESPSMVAIADYRALDEKSEQALQELATLKVEGELLKQENHDVATQLKNSQDELFNRSSELDTLRGELKTAQTLAGISGGGKSHQLQRQLDATKIEKLKFETERDDYKHKCKELGVQLQELSERNRNLTVENEEIPILRDSVEEMKYLEGKVKSYESVISKYKAKVEDAQEVKRQLKVLEDRNIMYMQQNMDLEEELRKLIGLKQQLDSQRQRGHELEADLAQERLHSLEMAQQVEEKSQAVKMFQEELMQVKQERDSLSQQVPGTPLAGEFRLFSSKLGSPVEEPDHGILGSGLVEAFTPEMREKMVRLEKENQLLWRRVETAESTPSRAVAEGRDSVGGARAESESRARALEQEVSLERLRREGMEWKQRAMEAQEAVRKYASENATLEEVRRAKDLDIEKYKKTLNKAKKIITENIGEKKTRAADSLEVQNLKVLLQEKDKQIEQLEREHRQGQASWEREEKLVVSAWHELGLMMHRKYSQDRLLTKQNMSFLAQQRQSLYETPVPINAAVASSTAATLSTGDTGHT